MANRDPIVTEVVEFDDGPDRRRLMRVVTFPSADGFTEEHVFEELHGRDALGHEQWLRMGYLPLVAAAALVTEFRKQQRR